MNIDKKKQEALKEFEKLNDIKTDDQVFNYSPEDYSEFLDKKVWKSKFYINIFPH